MGEKFHYQLESLLKKRQLEQDMASAEEAAARETVRRLNEQAQAIEKTIRVTEEELREFYLQGSELDKDRQALSMTYLSHQHKELEAKRVEVRNAEKFHEETLRKLEEARCGVKTLEKHKEGRHEEFKTEQERAEQRRVDELWLLRGRQDDR